MASPFTSFLPTLRHLANTWEIMWFIPLSTYTWKSCVLSYFPLTPTCFVTFSLYICSQSLATNGGRQVVRSCLLLILKAGSTSALVAGPHGLPPAWEEHLQ